MQRGRKHSVERGSGNSEARRGVPIIATGANPWNPGLSDNHELPTPEGLPKRATLPGMGRWTPSESFKPALCHPPSVFTHCYCWDCPYGALITFPPVTEGYLIELFYASEKICERD